MKKGFALVVFSLLAAGLLAIVFLSTGCKTVKRDVKVVHDSVVVSNNDVVHDTVERTHSVEVHDTVVGISGRDIVTFLHDTVIKQGQVRLVIKGNSIECAADSLTLVIANLKTVIDSVYGATRRSDFDSVFTRHSEVTNVTLVGKKWYVLFWERTVDFFALIGLVYCSIIVYRFFKKSFV